MSATGLAAHITSHTHTHTHTHTRTRITQRHAGVGYVWIKGCTPQGARDTHISRDGFLLIAIAHREPSALFIGRNNLRVRAYRAGRFRRRGYSRANFRACAACYAGAGVRERIFGVHIHGRPTVGRASAERKCREHFSRVSLFRSDTFCARNERFVGK